MTVGELITELQKYPDDCKVLRHDRYHEDKGVDGVVDYNGYEVILD